MRKVYLLINITILFYALSCNQADSAKVKPENIIRPDTQKVEKENKQPVSALEGLSRNENIAPYGGVMLISENVSFDSTFDFNVYNKDSTLWKRLKFSATLPDEPDVDPYLYNFDYYIMIFRWIEKKGDFYRVIIDEKKGTEKLISAHEKYLQFKTWPQHILSVYAVDFDCKKNPLRKNMDSTSSTIPYNREQTYMPLKIKGNWLQVKWGEEPHFQKGWIKWKTPDGHLLINIFYVE